MKIVCKENYVNINGEELVFPLKLKVLIKILGAPSETKIIEFLTITKWNELGIYCGYRDSNQVGMLGFKIKKGNQFPKEIFKGDIFVNNKSITDYAEKSIILGELQIENVEFELEGETVGFIKIVLPFIKKIVRHYLLKF
jgi:hypothetical protein